MPVKPIARPPSVALILADIIKDSAEDIASAIDQWGAASNEVDAILRECLEAAETDCRLSKAA